MRPGLHSIPAHLPFLATLAGHLRASCGDEPLALSRVTVLLPTRRACRALRDAFLRTGGGAPMLLPRLRPVGDVDGDELGFAAAEFELPPSIAPLRRTLLLARLVETWGKARGMAILPGQAAALARDLARLLDEVQATVGTLEPARLAALAPEEFAEHWQLVLRFLGILTTEWPGVLAAEGCLDPASRRNALLEAQIAAWRRLPPADPVIAAGIVGGFPALDRLLAAIVALPQGAIVLPGLDRAMDEEERQAAASDATHPQYGLLRCLATLDVAVEQVTPLGSEAAAARAPLVAEAMRPAETTASWRQTALAPEAVRGLMRLDCAGPQEESGAIALLMRQALETAGRTAALVTPDRELARRVAAELRRWGIEIDDSAGVPLGKTPPGAFLRLIAAAAEERLAPVALLALLKHPLAAGGLSPEALRAAVRQLERAGLRGPRPAPGFAGLRAAFAGKPDQLALVERLAAALEPFLALHEGAAPLAAFVAAHVAAAEALAATADEPGAARLWAGDAGEEAARFVAELVEAAQGRPELAGSDYPALFDALLAERVVRPAWGRHPRLFIWGLLEARLQRADLMILGGLNEGTWPADPGNDPWMSRPMRAQLGLRSPEERIGAAAHDFAQGLAAPEIVLTRASRIEGAETVPSRWLLRLETVLRSAGLADLLHDSDVFLGWQTLLDRPAERIALPPPAPCPPVEARPRRLSATRIETWMRDPYSIYARYVLRLTRLEELDAEPGAAERGQAIHAALDRFSRTHPGRLPEDAEPRLLAIGREEFGATLSRPGVWAFWWPRFERIVRWFVEAQRERERLLAESVTERSGRLIIAGPAGPFELTAIADRLDRLAAGGLAILDYKTGRVPRADDVELGFAPQLPLEAAIARAGGFELAAGEVTELAYWRLTGNDPPGEVKCIAEDAVEVRKFADDALAGLALLVERFDDPATPYRATPRPEWAPYFNDYAHLARLKEWAAAREPAG